MSVTFSRVATAFALAATVTLAAPVKAQDDAPNADTVVASVNGVDITLGHMLMIRAALPEQYQSLSNDVLWDGILDQVIRQEVLAQNERAVTTTRVARVLENETRALLASETLAAVSEDIVTEEALRDAYEAQFANAEQGVEYNASHILVETEEEAQALVAELEAGADFATLAMERSTGPSGPNGGQLGWFGTGMMVPPFEEAVVSMDPGTVSGPVQTQFGWHVIRLNETRATEAPAFEAVRAELEATLQNEAITAFVEAEVSAADVTRLGVDDIDVSVLSNLGLMEE